MENTDRIPHPAFTGSYPVFKISPGALTGVAQWVARCPTNSKVEGWIPSQVTCLVSGWVPCWGRVRGTLIHQCFSPCLSSSLPLMWTPTSRVHVLRMRQINSQGQQKSCGEKGMAWPLSERAPTLTWTDFYCFSGHITSRMVLIYYAQVCFRWLPFTDNKGKDVADYFKEKDVANARGKVIELITLLTLHPWEV